MNERTHSFIKKYTSHTLFSKGLRKGWCWLCVRGELEPETDWYILTQSSSVHCSTSSSFCWAAQPWALRAQAFCLELVLTLASYLQLKLQLELQLTATATQIQLTQAVCGTWLYNCLTPTCFLWAYTSAPNSTTSTGQGDIPISSTGCTCFRCPLLIYTSASLNWWLGRGSICYTISISKNQYNDVQNHFKHHLKKINSTWRWDPNR